jgi:hypothetical protein
LSARAIGFCQAEAVPVEAADLESRKDLIGHEVIVDDHVAFYVDRSGSADELQLKRTAVTFLVPRRLRPTTTSRKSTVQVRGVLKRDEGRLVCDVTALKPVPNDIERLEQGIAGLSAKDFESRQTWARWAERRARDFKDEALLKRAKNVEADALRIEADDIKRLTVDAPRAWLAMAQDARRRQVPEPMPSELAHRALRARLARASGIADVKAIVQAIESFFPDVATDRESARANLTNWEAPYTNDPAAAYHVAPQRIRKALDRRLWADATERLLELQSTKDLQSAIDLSERAEALLPEKPNLGAQLIEKAARLARQDLGPARLAEVKALALVYREKLHQPDESLNILRDWLKIQREKLSNTDAEGPSSLANLYDELLHDRVTAVELLRKAWRIDPKSKEIAEAFRSRGFHKVKEEWFESTSVTKQTPAAAKGLRGLTPEEVRVEIGSKPNRVSYVASRGQLIEQWIYELDSKMVRYVNLLHTPGDLKPRVVADYQVPRLFLKGGSGPFH